VLYEMLSGQTPFASANTQTTIARMMTQDAQPLHGIRSGVTEELDGAMLKALSRTPADRPSTASEFADSLTEANLPARSREQKRSTPAAKRAGGRRMAPILGTIGVVVLLAVAGILLSKRQTADARSLAVLPFDNIGRAEDAYFADGITEEVRGKLASIPGLRVTARSSSAQYKKTSKTPKEIGGELGVQYLLTGTVRWDKRADGQQTVRVTPELVLASDGSTKWQEPFDVVMSDIFDAQSTIAAQVAQRLDLELSSSVRERISKAPTENLAAYDEFLRGEQATDAMANPDPVRLDSGFVHYAKAAQMDPAFLQTLGRVAQIDINRYTLRPSAETSKTALDAVAAAERVDPASTIAHRVRALYMRDVEKNSRSAYDQLLAALKTDPNDAQLLGTISSTENSLGLFDSALVHVQRAAQIDPRSGTVLRQLATTLGYVRRFPEAIAEYDKLIATNPANLDAVQAKVRVQVLLGDMPGAKQTITEVLAHVDSLTLGIRFAYYQEMMWILDKSILKKVAAAKPMDFYKDPAMGSLKIGRTLLLLGDSAGGRVWGDTALRYIGPQIKENPDDAQLAEVRGRVNALAGNRAEAIADAERSLALRETKTDAAFGPYYKFQVARVMIQAGEYERAIDLLEPLLTIPAGMLTPAWLRLDPNFAPLRSNPRFRKMAGLG
jgi:TolB-like protein/Flp pilus assembly protein TadD